MIEIARFVVRSLAEGDLDPTVEREIEFLGFATHVWTSPAGTPLPRARLGV